MGKRVRERKYNTNTCKASGTTAHWSPGRRCTKDHTLAHALAHEAYSGDTSCSFCMTPVRRIAAFTLPMCAHTYATSGTTTPQAVCRR